MPNLSKLGTGGVAQSACLASLAEPWGALWLCRVEQAWNPSPGGAEAGGSESQGRAHLHSESPGQPGPIGPGFKTKPSMVW